MIRRPIIHRRNRRQLDASNVPSGPFVTWSAAIAGGKVVLTFGGVVQVIGLPPVTNEGVQATLAEQLSPNTLRFTFAAPAVPADVFEIPNMMDGIRTSTGGFAAAGTATLA